MIKCECKFHDHSLLDCDKDAILICEKCNKASCLPCSVLPMSRPFTKHNRKQHLVCPELGEK